MTRHHQRAPTREELEQRVVEAEATVKALLSGAVDAVLDAKTSSPILLREAQQAILRSEERYRRIVETAQEGIWIIDSDQRISFANPQMAEMLGYSVDEMRGLLLQDFLDGAVGTQAAKHLDLRREGVSRHVEICFRHKTGRDVWTLLTANPLLTAEGVYDGALAMVMDITERKRAEARILALTNVESANRAKSAFLANMSHELRTPLNAIIGFSQMLEDRLFGDLNPKQGKQVNHIFVAGKHLLKLINEILDLSMIESGKLALDMGPVDLHVVATEVHETVLTLASAKQQILTIAVPSLRFIGDIGRIMQILLNLVANAIKFTPEGGRIHIDAVATEEAGGRTIRFSVRDSGIGIKREDLDRLFIEFSRLDDSYSRNTEGTGLGLALTKRLVELHGGRISVVSNGPGTGSTFTVDLPEAPRQKLDAGKVLAGYSGNHLSSVPMRSSRGLILVVDDESSSQEMLSDALTSDGYEVMLAGTADQALEQVSLRPPMAVILDILLTGGRSGWEVLETLQSSAHTRNIPVIVVSVMDERVRARNQGACEALLKPVEMERLLLVVNAAVRRQRTNRTALVVDADPMIVKYLSFALRERGWNVLAASSGGDAILMAERNTPTIVIIAQTMPDITGLEVIERLSRNSATAGIRVLVHADQPLDQMDMARLDPERHAVVKKLQSDALLSEVERLCDGSAVQAPDATA